jgi:hypothetical protein
MIKYLLSAIHNKTHHFLCADLPIPLYVPKAQGTHRGCDGLRETEIRILKEREAKFVILANANQCACGIETLGLSLDDERDR